MPYRDIIQVNEEICNLRPPLDMDDKEAEALKKNYDYTSGRN
jgi:hypothetical protein